MDRQEHAMRVYLKAHGFKVHRKIDACDACTRLCALQFVASLPLSLPEKGEMAEWIVSEDFLE